MTCRVCCVLLKALSKRVAAFAVQLLSRCVLRDQTSPTDASECTCCLGSKFVSKKLRGSTVGEFVGSHRLASDVTLMGRCEPKVVLACEHVSLCFLEMHTKGTTENRWSRLIIRVEARPLRPYGAPISYFEAALAPTSTGCLLRS